MDDPNVWRELFSQLVLYPEKSIVVDCLTSRGAKMMMEDFFKARKLANNPELYSIKAESERMDKFVIFSNKPEPSTTALLAAALKKHANAKT